MQKLFYKNAKKAFSLIELSVVILIIGIIIAGIVQGSRLLNEFKLTTAKTPTQSAPVSSITGLLLWLEPTSDNSFIASEAEDENNLTTWYDINPQTTVKNNFSRGVSNNSVTYEKSGSNSIPAVEFSGSGVTALLSGSAISTPYNAMTVFIVAKSNDTSSSNWRTLFKYSGLHYQKKGDNHRNISFVGITDCTETGYWSSSPEIASVVYYGISNSNSIRLFVNGASTSLDNITSAINFSTVSSIGLSAEEWRGLVSEIIVFDRVLKISERQDIKTYLGKKYGIKMTKSI